MNLLELRTAFIKQSGHYNLVGVQPYSTQTGLPDPAGTDVGPDFAVDNGADYYINKALKYLAHRLKTQGTKQFRRYDTVVGQTVLADIDKIIAISDVRCGQYSGRAVTMADVVARTAAPTDGAFQYAVGTLSAPTFMPGAAYLGGELHFWPFSNAWKFDGTALRGKGRRISAVVEYEADEEILYYASSEYICFERNDDETDPFTITASFDNGATYAAYVNGVAHVSGDTWHFGGTVPSSVLPLGSNDDPIIIRYKCSVPVKAAAFEWPHDIIVSTLVHDAGNRVKKSSSIDINFGVVRFVPPYGIDMVVEETDSLIAEQRVPRQHKNLWGIFLDDEYLTLEERDGLSVAIWGIFPTTGIFITPPSDGTPVDVEAWFDPAPLVGNYDANWWTDEHADLIIDGAIIELAAVHMNPSGRHLAAQRDQNLSRIIASDTVTTVETLGNRFI